MTEIEFAKRNDESFCTAYVREFCAKGSTDTEALKNLIEHLDNLKVEAMKKLTDLPRTPGAIT